MPSSPLYSKHSSHSPNRSSFQSEESQSQSMNHPYKKVDDPQRKINDRSKNIDNPKKYSRKNSKSPRQHKRSRSRQRQRQRQRQKRHHDKRQHHRLNQHQDPDNSQGKDHLELALYDHLYFIQDENAKVSIESAIWSTVVNYGFRPKKILIICQNQKKLIKLIKSSNINRQMIAIDQDSKENIKDLTKTHDILLMTQEKSSITLGLDEGDIQIFDLIINYGKTYSVQFYSLLPQFIGEHGIIFSVFENRKQVQRHERKLKVKFKEISGETNPNQIEKQIFNQIQFSNRLNTHCNLDGLSLLKTLPYSLQETALRLFSLIKDNYQPKKSLYLERQGHTTICLKTDTEFNSIKYIWNFIREEMSPNIVKNIKDMRKFQNQRGVLFNVPVSDLGKWENLESKIRKGDKKYKGYKLYEFINQELPKLQDIESEQYKLSQQKKQQALKNRHKLQLFIAGVPYDSNQVDIRKYFAEKDVNLFLIRILRDSSGFSKGIAFALAENQSHFQRAIQLNGVKFGDRQLRIKLADQRDSKDK